MRLSVQLRRSRRFVAVGAAALSLVTVAACGSDDGGESGDGGGSAESAALLGPDKAATGSPVKIGWVSTGQTQAVDTTDEIKSAQAVVAYANAKLGGLGGHPIELITCEDKSVPADAQSCGNKFVAEGVAAVAGGSPGQTDPWIEIINPAGIPTTLNFASTQKVLRTDNVFVWGNPLSAYGTPAAFARDQKLASGALLVIDVPAASGPARTLGPAFFGNAGASLDVVAIAPGTADMTPQIQTAQGKNPAMYYILGDPTFCSSAIRGIKTLGIDAPIAAFARCIGTDQGASIPGGYEGVTIVSQANVDPNDAEFKLFSAVIDTYGDDLTTDGNALSGYQGMLGLVRAFNAGGSTDVTPAGISAAIKSMPATPYPLGGGSTFQCNGQAVAAVSKNVCSSTGYVADASSTGELSNFRTLDATGIYKLGG